MNLIKRIFNFKSGEHAIVKRLQVGKMKGQYRAILRAPNSEVIGVLETYHNKKDIMDTLKKYFPNFTIVDQTEDIIRGTDK